MSVLFHSVYQASKWVEENTEPNVKDLWLMGSIIPVATILFVYLAFVLKIGPEFMRFRKPLNIDHVVIVYNIVQVLFSVYLVKEAFVLLWLRDDYRFFCVELNKNDADLASQQARLVWMFLLSKVLDLFDTVFFVLRKKQNQVTFLHVYHHTLVIIAGWFLTNFYSGGQAAFFGTINACIHIIMYTYYLLAILDSDYKKAWWKKYLTSIQLAQFVITGLHAAITLFEPDCDFPRVVMMLLIPQDIFMFILFWDFYQKAYVKKSKNKQS